MNVLSIYIVHQVCDEYVLNIRGITVYSVINGKFFYDDFHTKHV